MSVVVKQLGKQYGRQWAVRNLSFEAHPGEIVGFLGPNGAGKSTSMKMICGYLHPTEGTALVSGYNVRTASLQVRRQIGYLAEHNPLYTDMYVREFLHFTGQIHGLRGRQLRRRIDEMIQLCGLERERHKKIGALSKGYRQRVGLAQALLHDPPVLILDEPTSGLDPNQILEIREVIRQASINKTIIFSTHILQEVEALCKRVLIINQGQLIVDTYIDQLRQRVRQHALLVEFAHDVEVSLLEQLPTLVALEKLQARRFRLYAEDIGQLRQSLMQCIHTQGWLLESMHNEQNRLEDIFRQLTQSNTFEQFQR